MNRGATGWKAIAGILTFMVVFIGLGVAIAAGVVHLGRLEPAVAPTVSPKSDRTHSWRVLRIDTERSLVRRRDGRVILIDRTSHHRFTIRALMGIGYGKDSHDYIIELDRPFVSRRIFSQLNDQHRTRVEQNWLQYFDGFKVASLFGQDDDLIRAVGHFRIELNRNMDSMIHEPQGSKNSNDALKEFRLWFEAMERSGLHADRKKWAIDNAAPLRIFQSRCPDQARALSLQFPGFMSSSRASLSEAFPAMKSFRVGDEDILLASQDAIVDGSDPRVLSWLSDSRALHKQDQSSPP
jgi:hypothetical protein